MKGKAWFETKEFDDQNQENNNPKINKEVLNSSNDNKTYVDKNRNDKNKICNINISNGIIPVKMNKDEENTTNNVYQVPLKNKKQKMIFIHSNEQAKDNITTTEDIKNNIDKSLKNNNNLKLNQSNSNQSNDTNISTKDKSKEIIKDDILNKKHIVDLKNKKFN